METKDKPNIHTGYHIAPKLSYLGHAKNYDNQAFEARHKPCKQAGHQRAMLYCPRNMFCV